jgi:predicted RNA-binding protein with TRAM domain
MVILGVSLRTVSAFHRQSLSQHLSRRPSWRSLSKRHGRRRGKNKETSKIEGPFNYHDEVDLFIEDLSNLGDGVAKVDLPASSMAQAGDGEVLPASKYVVMVPHVMVGERVRARVWSNRGSHSLADLVEVSSFDSAVNYLLYDVNKVLPLMHIKTIAYLFSQANITL